MGTHLQWEEKKSKVKAYVATLFFNTISKKVFVEFQASTCRTETIKSKRSTEGDTKTHGVEVKAFRSDNGIFRSAKFRDKLGILNQVITYYGVNATY